MKCLLPSFIADFVQVVSWIVIDGEESNEIGLADANLGNALAGYCKLSPESLKIPFAFLIISQSTLTYSL